MGSPCSRFSEEVWEERFFGRLSPALHGEVEAHLAECARCRKRWRETAGEIEFLRTVLEVWQSGWERRGSERVAARGTVVLLVGRGRQTAEMVVGRLRDESRTGLGLVCRRRFRRGQRVTAVRGEESRPARVRWCRLQGKWYRVGLELLVA